MNVAIVHDAFVQAGGGERVAAELVRAFDGAPLFTAAIRPELLPPSLASGQVTTSFVQALVGRGLPLPALAGLLPAAFARLDAGPVDAVISSSAAFAHHVRVPAGAVHLCYCHTPPRFLWEAGDYFHEQGARRGLTWPGRALYRRLDLAASRRVDLYLANSGHVADRIRRVYGREARVVYPPVDTGRFEPSVERSGRFLLVSRLRNQKRVDLAVAAANLAALPLDVIGDGPERPRLERLAGPTVRFLGWRSDAEVRHAMARAAGVLVPAAGDFGLTIVEAQASGRPPIAFAAGGALEIVEDGETGFLFADQTPRALARAMRRALEVEIPPSRLLGSARRFDVAVFRQAVRIVTETAVEVGRAAEMERQRDAVRPGREARVGERRRPALDLGTPIVSGAIEWQEPPRGI